MRNTEYWKNGGAKKIFSHPVCPDWLAGLDNKAAILDLGCGYGRLTPILRENGFTGITGYDPSLPLIERALRENPGATYTSDVSSLSSQAFDLILCFALFTSCPLDAEQNELTALINTVSHIKTRLYISDYETQDNPLYFERYEECKHGIYGCFASGPAFFRHHAHGHFDALLPGWKKMRETAFEGASLHNNAVTIHQYLFEKTTNLQVSGNPG